MINQMSNTQKLPPPLMAGLSSQERQGMHKTNKQTNKQDYRRTHQDAEKSKLTTSTGRIKPKIVAAAKNEKRQKHHNNKDVI